MAKGIQFRGLITITAVIIILILMTLFFITPNKKTKTDSKEMTNPAKATLPGVPKSIPVPEPVSKKEKKS